MDMFRVLSNKFIPFCIFEICIISLSFGGITQLLFIWLKLEKEFLEICDELYELYTALISQEHDACGYKTYFIVSTI